MPPSRSLVFAVSLTPFSTTLLAEFISYRKALLIYWLNILLLGAALHLSWECASGRGLVKDDIPPEARSAIKRRTLIGQGLFAFGAFLCIYSTYRSIGFIVLVQLNYAIAPRLPGGLAPERPGKTSKRRPNLPGRAIPP